MIPANGGVDENVRRGVNKVRHRGYHTAAQRYEFYFRVVKTIFYKRVQRVSKILFFFYQEKIKFISSNHRVIFFLLYRQEYFCTKNSVRAGSYVFDILTSGDMENTPLESRMWFRMNFTSSLFSTKTLLSI